MTQSCVSCVSPEQGPPLHTRDLYLFPMSHVFEHPEYELHSDQKPTEIYIYNKQFIFMVNSKK